MNCISKENKVMKNLAAKIRNLARPQGCGTGPVFVPWPRLDSVAPAIEVECPLEGCVASGADESGRFEDASHAPRGMNESPKRGSPEPIPRVFQDNRGAYVPPGAGIGQRGTLSRARGRSSRERFHIP